jgi:protein TonB
MRQLAYSQRRAQYRWRPSNAFLICLALSLCAHVYIISLYFSNNPSTRVNRADLEVVIVNAQSRRTLPVSDLLAQHNLQGGGNTDRDVVATVNVPISQFSTTQSQVSAASERVIELENTVKKLLAIEMTTSDLRDLNRIDEPIKQSGTNSKHMQADSLSEETRNRLEARIEKEWQRYQKRPNREFIGANTRAVEFAAYVDEWKQRIEDIGTKLYSRNVSVDSEEGVMVVTVSINSDGSVERVLIDVPSGSRRLDRVAREIVSAAAPFRPFDPELRRRYDILSITRRWSFQKNEFVVTRAQ